MSVCNINVILEIILLVIFFMGVPPKGIGLAFPTGTGTRYPPFGANP